MHCALETIRENKYSARVPRKPTCCGMNPHVWKVQKDQWLVLKILHSCPCRAVALNQGGLVVRGHLTVPGGRPFGLHNLRCWFSTPTNALRSPSNSQNVSSMAVRHPDWNGHVICNAEWRTGIDKCYPIYTLTDIYLFIYLYIYLYIFEHTSIWRTVVFENHEKSFFLLLFRFSPAHFFLKSICYLKILTFWKENN